MSELPPAVRRGHGRIVARVTGACLAAGVSMALIMPPASAETLSDLRRKVTQTQESQDAARSQLAESRQSVGAASQRLLDSETALQNAQQALAEITAQLEDARGQDQRLEESLNKAREELELAKQRVAQAEADVNAQLALIGAAARESFQQQTDLQGLGIVFGAETPAELGQRLQWSTTIFDTQAAEKARLDAVLDEVEKARQAQAEIEATIAREKAESEAMLARIGELEEAARAQHKAVADLVAANERARSEAQSELADDEAAYRRLQDDEARLQAEIEEISRVRGPVEVPAVVPKQAPGAPAVSRPSGAVSSYGFIRPVQANYGSAFGQRFHPILKVWRAHNGVDMGAVTGTPIYAARDGVVLKAGPNGGFGNFVLIGHGNIINGQYTTTGYAHQSRVVATVGQQVKQGDLIGYVGSTGLSTSPHLHFELRLGGVPVNPVHYVP